MQAQDKPKTETFYDVYLDDGARRYFCKRYKRSGAARNLSHALDLKYKHLGWAGQIETVEIPTAGLRSENGGHTAGSSPKETGEPPTE